jgi:hypothetical protein
MQQQLLQVSPPGPEDVVGACYAIPGSHEHKQQLLPGARIQVLVNLAHTRTKKVQALTIEATIDALLGPAYPHPRDPSKHLVAVRLRDVQYSGKAATDYVPLDPARVELRLDQPGAARCKGFWWLLMPAPAAAAAAVSLAKSAGGTGVPASTVVHGTEDAAATYAASPAASVGEAAAVECNTAAAATAIAAQALQGSAAKAAQRKQAWSVSLQQQARAVGRTAAGLPATVADGTSGGATGLQVSAAAAAAGVAGAASESQHFYSIDTGKHA